MLLYLLNLNLLSTLLAFISFVKRLQSDTNVFEIIELRAVSKSELVHTQREGRKFSVYALQS